MEKLLVTSALPYANGPIHFGHVAGAYLPADIWVRYKRAAGASVLFICGTDEHGTPITVNAAAAGQHPRDFTAHWHRVIKSTFDRLGIEFDNFSRTSLPHHYALTQRFFTDLDKNGYWIEKSEEQPYCAVDKQFLPDRFLLGTCPKCGWEKARGDECPRCGTWIGQGALVSPRCKLCGTPPELRTTRHWYLDLAKLQPKLEAWLATKRGFWKPNVLGELDKYLREGLKPRAMTRDLTWGVPVPKPGAEGKVLYVWFDAPIGYVSSTIEWAEKQGRPDAWKDWWCDPQVKLHHFVGKDNIVFHTLTWPGMLLGQDQPLALPHDVPANEFFNLEGAPFKTSEGWYIELDDFFAKYPCDAARYAIARNLPETGDSDWRWEDFQAKVNAELNDAFGNLAQRTLKFVGMHCGGRFPAAGPLAPRDLEELEVLAGWPARLAELLDGFKIRAAAAEWMELARRGNRYFDEQKPWKTVKIEPALAHATLVVCGRILSTLAVLGRPFVPAAAAKLWAQLGHDPARVAAVPWAEAGRIEVPAGQALGTIEPLFTKIPDEAIAAEVAALHERKKKLMSQEQAAKPPAPAGAAPAAATPPPAPAAAPAAPGTPPAFGAPTTFDDWLKVDLRVGLVKEAEEVPKSAKLLKLKIDLGTETRQVLAGMKEFYTPAEMVGRKVIVLVNLPPRKMMGLESQGMVLAANDPATGRATLLAPAGDPPPGSKIS